MTDHPTYEDPARSRRIFWIKLFAAMALSLLAVFVLYRVAAYRSLNQRIQAIRDAGYPISPDEFDAWYAVPDDKNAADTYLRAFNAFPFEPNNEGVPIVSTVKDYTPGQPLDDAMAKRIEDYLALHTESIALLEEATQIESCRFPGDLREGIDLLLPHLGKLRQSARLLQLQSILDAHRGDYDLAAQRCITILKLARALDNEPILISALVTISIEALACGQIEILVTSGHVSDEQLQALTAALQQADVDHLILRAMVGERCFIHGIFQDSETLAGAFSFGGGSVNRAALSVWRGTGLVDIDHSCALDIMTGYVEFAENPTWPMPASFDEFHDRVPRICLVTRIMIPAISSAFKAAQQNEAKRRAMITAIAVERYRQKHNRFPSQLTDLAPVFIDAVPMDTFAEQPLRYRTEDAGVIIYSLGADSTDDTGKLYNDDGDMYEPGSDIPITFGGLQEIFWPQPEEEEDDWGYGGYGDPYGGGYGGGYGEPVEEETEALADDDATEKPQASEAEKKSTATE